MFWLKTETGNNIIFLHQFFPFPAETFLYPPGAPNITRANIIYKLNLSYSLATLWKED